MLQVFLEPILLKNRIVSSIHNWKGNKTRSLQRELVSELAVSIVCILSNLAWTDQIVREELTTGIRCRPCCYCYSWSSWFDTAPYKFIQVEEFLATGFLFGWSPFFSLYLLLHHHTVVAIYILCTYVDSTTLLLKLILDSLNLMF